MIGTLVVKGLNTLVFNLNTTKDFISTSGRVQINVNILDHEKKHPDRPQNARYKCKTFCISSCNNRVPLFEKKPKILNGNSQLDTIHLPYKHDSINIIVQSFCIVKVVK